MKKVWIFVACIAFLLMVSPALAAHPQQEGGPTATMTVTSVPLIIGIGQSNMAGRAVMPSITTTALPTGAVMMIADGDGTYSWVHMEEPSNVWNGDGSNYTYSPASAIIGRLMAAKGWARVAFINCGVGGSAVSSWAPTYVWATNADNFNDCWARIASAQSSNRYQVAAIVVINGETETNNTPGPDDYEDNMNKLYIALNLRLRTETPQANRTPLPVVFLALGATPTGPVTKPNWKAIRETQIKLPTTYPGKNWNSADSLGVPRDSSLHFHNPTEVDVIGNRLADALLNLTGLPPSTPTVTLTPTQTPTPTPTP